MSAVEKRPVREFITRAELPRFTRTDAEDRLMTRIAKRAMTDLEAARHSDRFTAADVAMDLAATHANGNPLRLKDLLAADGFNFAHDILGIRRNLDRSTGALMKSLPSALLEAGHLLPSL